MTPVSRLAAATLATLAVASIARAQAPSPAPPPASAAATPTTPQRTLYLVGYSHLDTEWCWSYPQVIREFLANTLHDNFALFDQYPDYTFNWTGANRYKLMKEYFPDDWQRLKGYVAKGRWVPSGSSLEEGDVCIPSSESIIRQVLYGNRFFQKEFGTFSDEYMLPDCFGFPASLPTLLAHSGVKGFSTQKLTWGSAVGIPFNVGVWVGPDGQGTVSALNPGSYTSRVQRDLSQDDGWLRRIDEDGAKSGLFADFAYFGTGDRGGAPDRQSVEWVEKSLHGTGPIKVVAGRADALFTSVSPAQAAKLPHYQGDLLLTQHSSGSATSEAEMKRWNHRNELLGDAAERASVAASLLGAQAYPYDRLTDAWWRFLPGQFHDLMAGTALPASYQFAWNDQVLAANEFADVETQSVGAVARALDTRIAGGTPLVVYNPLSTAREDVAEASVPLPYGMQGATVRVSGPDGREVPAQILGRSENGGTKIAFLAHVPAMSFSVFRADETFNGKPSPPSATLPASPLKASKTGVENARYRVRLNAAGDIASIYDKAAKRELLSAPMRLAFQFERPTQYPAWNMDWTDQQKPPRGYVGGPAAVRIVENGPARVALEVSRTTPDGSRFAQIVRLSAGDAGNRVEFVEHIDWRTSSSALKAVFPLTVASPTATYSWGVGTVQRGVDNPKAYEWSSHDWFDQTAPDGKYGVAVLNEAKYGSDKPDAKTLRLTLLYTPGVRDGFQHQATQDWGRHTILYALQGHKGDWRAQNTPGEAARLNQPLATFVVGLHPGPLGKSFSLGAVSTPQVAVAALKRTEDGGGFLVRLFELDGKPAKNVRLRFAAPIASLREVDGQERPIASTGAAKIDASRALVFDMAPYRPRAFEITFGKAPAHLAPPSAGMPLALPFNVTVTASAKREDAAPFTPIDADGHALPAELLPAKLESGGIGFRLGDRSPGAKNAVSCMGQRIALPPGKGGARRVYLLAASQATDALETFRIDNKPAYCTAQSGGGWIGQWDTRLWGGKVPELTYGWSNPMIGLVPGYIKPAPVAWYADHGRNADGTNDPYRFVYLFRYALDLPPNAKSLTLPKDAHLLVLGATIAENPNDEARPAAPLFDSLADHRDISAGTAPVAQPAGGRFSDSTEVTLRPPLYYGPGLRLHYTVDGSAPGPNSPVWTDGGQPLLIDRPTTLRVRQIADGTNGELSDPEAKYRFEVHDTTPPRITGAEVTGDRTVRVHFSEPVTTDSAGDAAHYTLGGGIGVTAAAAGDDGRSVTLTTSADLPRDGTLSLTTSGIRDRSPAGNALVSTAVPVRLLTPVFTHAQTVALTGMPRQNPTFRNVANLPTAAGSHWTINEWVHVSKELPDLTVIGGFGDDRDEAGTQRYLTKFANGIHFWGGNVDLDAGEQFALGRWQMITLTYDGRTLRIYVDGVEKASNDAEFTDAAPIVHLGPASPWGPRGGRAAGVRVADFAIWSEALPASQIQNLFGTKPTEK